ncbi:hypothetical protein Ae201684_000815 [Aphanomyces euteiches]|uniref:B box-type domain-containing protein n=1 Tax=Aphanomyces euteiches TaxID=100861 RepID=A0A6G0XV18_9STRA|nr:hypothetical protein Ae201684_000815 [Aphanomyces euteiches]KAH9135784.1 hypothetical protein AeRB84_018870 [Aphanomyces euteiches]
MSAVDSGANGDRDDCAVCEVNAGDSICRECAIVFCTRCFDSLHGQVAAVRNHHSEPRRMPSAVAKTLTCSTTETTSTVQSDETTTPLQPPNASPTSIKAKSTTPRFPSCTENGDIQAPPAKKSRQENTPPNLHPFNGSARTRNIPQATSNPAIGPTSNAVTPNDRPTTAAGNKQNIAPTPTPLRVAPNLPTAINPMQQVHVAPMMAPHARPPVVLTFQQPQNSFLQHPKPAAPPAVATSVASTDDTTLEDIFFDRFNSVNDQLEKLDAQLHSVVAMLPGCTNVTTAGALNQQLHAIKQNRIVMTNERELALAKVIIHTPKIFSRVRALPATSLQDIPEMLSLKYQKLKEMAVHLKRALDNLAVLQARLGELSTPLSPQHPMTIRELHENIAKNRLYIARLKHDRYDECLGLVTVAESLRRKIRTEFNELKEKRKSSAVN